MNTYHEEERQNKIKILELKLSTEAEKMRRCTERMMRISEQLKKLNGQDQAMFSFDEKGTMQ